MGSWGVELARKVSSAVISWVIRQGTDEIVLPSSAGFAWGGAHASLKRETPQTQVHEYTYSTDAYTSANHRGSPAKVLAARFLRSYWINRAA